LNEHSGSPDFGQLRSTYRAYDLNDDCFDEAELLGDSEARARGNHINETHEGEFYIVAHRKTAGMGDVEIGRWGTLQVYDVNRETHEITPRQDMPEV
jgi:hypothetical protein